MALAPGARAERAEHLGDRGGARHRGAWRAQAGVGFARELADEVIEPLLWEGD